MLGPRYALLPVDLRDLATLEAALCGGSSSSQPWVPAAASSAAAGETAAGQAAAAGAVAGAAAGAAEPPPLPPEATGDCGCGGSAAAGPDGMAACAAAIGAAPAAARPVLDPQLPTFVLSECVLVYMEARESAEVVRWLGQRLHCAAMAIYEQVRLVLHMWLSPLLRALPPSARGVCCGFQLWHFRQGCGCCRAGGLLKVGCPPPASFLHPVASALCYL